MSCGITLDEDVYNAVDGVDDDVNCKVDGDVCLGNLVSIACFDVW